PPDFLDFLRLLNREKVKYLLIGGYAVAHYGYVRATGDMDVFVDRTAENATRLSAACRLFGLGDEWEATDFLEVGVILRFGLPPLRLEILNQISGVTFEECFYQHSTVDVEDVTIPVISLERLLKNKEASGRDKDLLDLRRLQP
ncbi:MAG: nucleotidyltransferase, partial [Opitutales bacterium]